MYNVKFYVMLFSRGGQACSASSYIQHCLFKIHLNLSIKMVQAPSMEGLSKAQLHPILKQPLQYTQYSIAIAQTHATKFTSNLENLWLGLPLCELQVNLLNHVLGMLS